MWTQVLQVSAALAVLAVLAVLVTGASKAVLIGSKRMQLDAAPHGVLKEASFARYSMVYQLEVHRHSDIVPDL